MGVGHWRGSGSLVQGLSTHIKSWVWLSVPIIPARGGKEETETGGFLELEASRSS